MFSKACEYGIKASIYISEQSKKNTVVSLKDVASAIDSPTAFTAKILQALAKHQIIASIKGASGGYIINKNNNIRLKHIVYAIDGDKIYNGCGLGFEHCNEQKPCPIHFQFKQIRDDLKKMLEQTTIEELSIMVDVGKTCLKR